MAETMNGETTTNKGETYSTVRNILRLGLRSQDPSWLGYFVNQIGPVASNESVRQT